jgi:hypothetical protein
MISGRESVSSTGSADGATNQARLVNKAKEEMLNVVKVMILFTVLDSIKKLV